MLIPVLKEAEFPRRRPKKAQTSERPRWENSQRRGESGIQGGASRKKPRSTSIRREIEDEAEDKEAHFSSAANGPAAHVTKVTEHAGPDCERN